MSYLDKPIPTLEGEVAERFLEMARQNIARFLNTKENIIHKMVAYKCSKCGKWHVGSNSTVLTDEDRKHYKDMLYIENKLKLI